MTLLSSLFKALSPLPVVRICYSLTTCKPAKYVFARWHFIVFEVYGRVKSEIFGTYCSKNGSVKVSETMALILVGEKILYKVLLVES